MLTKLLKTQGQGIFEEVDWIKPNITENQIEVRALLTGVCRSDVDMMLGKFACLPEHMMGHEGVAQVTKTGANVTDVKVGDYVATQGEPAYADYYNVNQNQYVPVPEVHPRYILEPVACGVNLITQELELVGRRAPGRLLLVGTGFLAWVAYNTIKYLELDFDITVIGNSNPDIWKSELPRRVEGVYDVIIDLSTTTDYMSGYCLANNGLMILGTDKQLNLSLAPLLWRATTIVMPSPRTDNFIHAMRQAKDMIQSGQLSVDNYWTQAYSRSTAWAKAFADSANRQPGYNRAYIDWRI